MRTWIFKDYLEDKHGEFIPMQTIESEEFGRHFFIDIGFHFISAPSFKDGGYDESQLNYVSDWSDWEDVDFGGDATFEIATNKLFEIYRKLCWNQWQEDKEKAHTEMCEYMEAVETGEIHFL